MTPIVMAGGAGSRLWPLSRELFPKQFISLDGQNTLLQSTLQRIGESNFKPPVIVCNEEHRFIVAEQARHTGYPIEHIILEPVGRDTAPALALAAIQLIQEGKDDLLFVLPADHVIKDINEFKKAAELAQQLAEEGSLVTFGIIPSYAETGYGYINVEISENGIGEPVPVKGFIEKPTKKKAEEYIKSGHYYWNSGMFMFRASKYLEELSKYRPEIVDACKAAIKHAKKDMDFIRIDRGYFECCPADSIDYAVMENTKDAWVVPFSSNWSDVGNWNALWDISTKNSDKNVIKGDVISHDSYNSYLHATDRLVVTLGVDNLIIVETRDAVLVASKDKAQDIKKIVEELKQAERSEYKVHRLVHRPWGKYESIDTGYRYQVKRITVNPGEKLSLQKHYHRAEHWVVVSGTALVHKDNEKIILIENESVYIPCGSIHSLENPGKIPLEIIEVQSGSYLGEDDIVRYQDLYGREENSV